MMQELLRASIVVPAAVILVWAAYVAVLVFWPASRPVDPGPTTTDLPSDAPPAVVALITHRWIVEESAAEATVIDLAARGHIEFRQPAADPRETTVHVVADDRRRTGAADLAPFERRVLDKIEHVTRGGYAPLHALQSRGDRDARAWWKAFRREVAVAARARGLSAPRLSSSARGMLRMSALVPAGAICVMILWSAGDSEQAGYVFGAFIWSFFPLYAFLGTVLRGERDTAQGRLAAAQWLGLRSFMKGDPVFAAVPPAAVAIWDRNLAYGTALGVNQAVLRLLDLGVGNPRRIWSAYGGTWRVVRVRIPRFMAKGLRLADIMRLAGHRTTVAVALVATAVVLSTQLWYARSRAPEEGPPIFGGIDPRDRGFPVPDFRSLDRYLEWLPAAIVVLVAVAALLAAWALVMVVRGVADLAIERTVVGEVLWLGGRDSDTDSDYDSDSDSDSGPPKRYVFTIDEGVTDRTTAWAVPEHLVDRCQPGDEVAARVRPWSRRVLSIDVLSRRRSRNDRLEPPPEDPDESLSLSKLVPSMVTTSLGDTAFWYSGIVGRGMWRGELSNATQAIVGVGDEACARRGIVAARVGDEVVRVLFGREGRHYPPETIAQRLQVAIDEHSRSEDRAPWRP